MAMAGYDDIAIGDAASQHGTVGYARLKIEG